jgi:O-antigen ligase
LILITERKVYINPLLFIPVLFFLVEFLWIFFDKSSVSARMQKMDSQFAMVLGPLSFLVLDPSIVVAQKDRIFKAFILGNLFATLYALGHSLLNLLVSDFAFSAYNLDRFFGELHHHTYYSLNALVAMLLIMYLVLKHKSGKFFLYAMLITWIVLDMGIFIAASRIGMFLAFLLNLVFIWLLAGRLKYRWLRYAGALIFFIAFILVIMNSSTFSYLKEKDNNLIVRILTENKQSIRLIIWKEATAQAWDAFPFGHGTGTLSREMSASLHKEIREGIIHMKAPDAHNQFIETFFETGLAGILILLTLFTLPLWLAIRRKKLLFSAFLMVFFFVCIFESVFKRQWGVESFILFYNVFSISLINQESSE